MSWSAAPDRPLTLVYDGDCRFCTAGSDRLLGLAAPGAVRRMSNKDERDMASLPPAARAGITSSLQIVSPEGEVASGAAAVARTLNTRPVWRLITWLYWVPVVRQLTDWLYALIARHRYRIMGRNDPCTTGACPRP